MTIPAASKSPSNRVLFKNILYASDFSKPSAQALPYALSIARKYGSHVFAVHVISSTAFQVAPPTMELRAIAAQALREASEGMSRLEAPLKGISHEILVRKGDIWAELSSIVNEKRIDLIVVGSHGRTGASKLLMGSVAEKIFRHAPCPVLTVGPNVSGEPRSIVDVHTILYPTDFTPESLAAAPYAISLAQEKQARLYLLHVTPDPVDEFTEASLMARLQTLVSPEANLWCVPKVFVESGDASQMIVDLTEELAVDLIVLGTKEVPILAGVTAHLAMSTASNVVRQALCPVLTIRGPV